MTSEFQQLIDGLQQLDAAQLKEVILRAMALLSDEDLTDIKEALGNEAPAGRAAIIGNQAPMMGNWPIELKGSAFGSIDDKSGKPEDPKQKKMVIPMIVTRD